MHNKLKKLWAAFAAVCLVGLLLAPTALAEETPPPAVVSLSGKLTLTGTLPANAAPYHFTLTADDPANPMPADATGDTKAVPVSAAGAFDFGSIEFTNIGDYAYTIKQQPGTVPNVTYDTTTYTATVYVRWQNEVGGAVTATLVLTEKGNDKKPDDMGFTNVGTAPDPGTEPKPGTKPDPGETPPPGTPDTVVPTPPTSATLQLVLGLLPQTSDEAPLLLFAVLAVASLIVLAVLLLRKRSKNKKDPK